MSHDRTGVSDWASGLKDECHDHDEDEQTDGAGKHIQEREIKYLDLSRSSPTCHG
jgi:hypothetical protein